MATKTVEFELSESYLELDLDYSYSYDPGKYCGLPENCYPEEEESEINLPANIVDLVNAHAVKMVKVWLKEIESQVADFEFDNAPAEWSADERKNYEEDRAADQYEERKYGGM